MKIIFSLPFIGLLLSSSLSGQSFSVLERRYEQSEDLYKRTLLAIELADKALDTVMLQEGIAYVEQALADCQKLDCDEAVLTEAEIIRAELMLKQGDSRYIDSLIIPLATAHSHQAETPPDLRARAKELVGYYYLINGRTLEAKTILEQARVLLLDHPDLAGRLSRVYEFQAFTYNFLSRYDSAIVYSHMVDSIFEMQRDTFQWINSLVSTSIFYKNAGQAGKSLAVLLQAQALMEQTSPAKELRFTVSGSLADAYADQAQYAKAKAVHTAMVKEIEAMYRAEYEDYLNHLWGAYVGLCRLYIKTGEGSLATENANKALKLCQEEASMLELQHINSYVLLADAQASTDQLEQSEQTIQDILTKYSTSESLEVFNSRIADILNRLYLQNDRTPGPEIIATFSPIVIRLIEKNKGKYNADELIARKLQLVFALYEASPEAPEYMEQLLATKDSVQAHALADMRSELLVAHETKEKEQKIRLQEAKLHQSYRERNLLIAFIVLLLSLVSLIALYYYQKRQLAKLLELKVEERTAELQAANTQLEQSNYELRTLSYIASHDIKEPIRNIGTYVGLIRHRLPTEYKEQFKDYFDTIKLGTQQLYTLIEDLAQYTSLSRELGQLSLEEVDLNSLARSIKESIHAYVETRNGQLIIKDLPHLKTHPLFLTTVLKNLVENGLKYNESSQPIVEIDYEATKDEHRIRVRDNGIGIEPAFQEDIFKMFKRLHSREQYDGTGIGLAIVQLVVTKLGGRIELNSTPGQGSEFIIVLPHSL